MDDYDDDNDGDYGDDDDDDRDNYCDKFNSVIEVDYMISRTHAVNEDGDN